MKIIILFLSLFTGLGVLHAQEYQNTELVSDRELLLNSNIVENVVQTGILLNQLISSLEGKSEFWPFASKEDFLILRRIDENEFDDVYRLTLRFKSPDSKRLRKYVQEFTTLLSDLKHKSLGMDGAINALNRAKTLLLEIDTGLKAIQLQGLIADLENQRLYLELALTYAQESREKFIDDTPRNEFILDRKQDIKDVDGTLEMFRASAR